MTTAAASPGDQGGVRLGEGARMRPMPSAIMPRPGGKKRRSAGYPRRRPRHAAARSMRYRPVMATGPQAGERAAARPGKATGCSGEKGDVEQARRQQGLPVCGRSNPHADRRGGSHPRQSRRAGCTHRGAGGRRPAPPPTTSGDPCWRKARTSAQRQRDKQRRRDPRLEVRLTQMPGAQRQEYCRQRGPPARSSGRCPVEGGQREDAQQSQPIAG